MYQADDTGEREIYVHPFPDVEAGKWQVSTSGGQSPVWGPDGEELFYVNPQGMMRVAIDTEASFSFDPPERLFDVAGFVLSNGEGPAFDITTDGQRFLMVKSGATALEATQPLPAQINVVLNWTQELLERVPVN